MFNRKIRSLAAASALLAAVSVSGCTQSHLDSKVTKVTEKTTATFTDPQKMTGAALDVALRSDTRAATVTMMSLLLDEDAKDITAETLSNAGFTHDPSRHLFVGVTTSGKFCIAALPTDASDPRDPQVKATGFFWDSVVETSKKGTFPKHGACAQVTFTQV